MAATATAEAMAATRIRNDITTPGTPKNHKSAEMASAECVLDQQAFDKWRHAHHAHPRVAYRAGQRARQGEQFVQTVRGGRERKQVFAAGTFVTAQQPQIAMIAH